MPRDIASQQIPGEDDRSADEVLQPRTADKTPAFRKRRETDAQKPTERRQADECQDETARILEISRSQSAQRDDHELDSAGGELQKRSIDTAEPKAADEARCEVRYAAVYYTAPQTDQHETMHFDIQQRLQRLAHLELLSLNPNHIPCNAINRHNALLMAQKLRRGRTIRHNPKEHPRPNEVHQPDDQENELPRLDVRAVRVAESVAEKCTNHCRHPVECEEDTHPQRLLRARVEHGYDVHDRGTDACFKHTQQEPQCQYACIVLGGNVAA